LLVEVEVVDIILEELVFLEDKTEQMEEGLHQQLLLIAEAEAVVVEQAINQVVKVVQE
jgi:hypothetical protein